MSFLRGKNGRNNDKTLKDSSLLDPTSQKKGKDSIKLKNIPCRDLSLLPDPNSLSKSVSWARDDRLLLVTLVLGGAPKSSSVVSIVVIWDDESLRPAETHPRRPRMMSWNDTETFEPSLESCAVYHGCFSNSVGYYATCFYFKCFKVSPWHTYSGTEMDHPPIHWLLWEGRKVRRREKRTFSKQDKLSLITAVNHQHVIDWPYQNRVTAHVTLIPPSFQNSSVQEYAYANVYIVCTRGFLKYTLV